MPFTLLSASAISGGVGDSLRPNSKPLIINGDMAVAQRGTSTAGVGGSNIFASCDRWKLAKEGTPSARFTQSQDTDVPTGEGFTSSLKMDCTTAAGSPDADDAIVIQQKIEAQDLQLLKYGTSNAEKITLSFWVKATKTGTNVVWIYQNDDNRSQAQSYTVNSTNTWEKKVLVFNADTTGVIDNNSGEGFRISWWLTAGTNFTSGTLSTAWESHTAANNAVGQVNNADSTSNNWYLTGVQLEVGEYTSSTLPDFQHESFQNNYLRCLRYYQKSYEYDTYGGAGTEEGVVSQFMGADGTGSGTSYSAHSTHWIVPMRTDPSVTVYDRQGNSGKLTYVTSNFNRTDNQNYTAWHQTEKLFSFYNHSDVSKSGCQWHYLADAEL